MQQTPYRPRFIAFHHRGHLAKVYFVWGHAANPIPNALHVSLPIPGTNITFVRSETARYLSFSRAMESGQQLVIELIEHLMGESRL